MAKKKNPYKTIVFSLLGVGALAVVGFAVQALLIVNAFCEGAGRTLLTC